MLNKREAELKNREEEQNKKEERMIERAAEKNYREIMLNEKETELKKREEENKCEARVIKVKEAVEFIYDMWGLIAERSAEFV